jgi:hypothetical protein
MRSFLAQADQEIDVNIGGIVDMSDQAQSQSQDQDQDHPIGDIPTAAPPLLESTTTIAAPPLLESTTTIAALPLLESTTTVRSPILESIAAPPLLESTTTIAAPPLLESTATIAAPPLLESATTIAAPPLLESIAALIVYNTLVQAVVQLDRCSGRIEGGDLVTLVCAFSFDDQPVLYFGRVPICLVESHRQYTITTPAWRDANGLRSSLEIPIWLDTTKPQTLYTLTAIHTQQPATYLYEPHDGMAARWQTNLCVRQAND